MKKHFLIFLFGLFGATLLTAQKNSYNIGVLLDNSSTETDSIFMHLPEQIKTVVGEDADIYFPRENILINNLDLQKAEDNYQRLLSNNTDIILAFGVVNNVVINKQSSYPKPTILFGAFNRDLVEVDLEKATSGVPNFTYLIESKSYQNDLEKLKELTDFKKVGIVIENEFQDILPLQELFDKELATLGAEYKLIPFKNTEDIKSNLDGVDAIYLAGGFFLSDAEIKELANIFIEKKLPSFTSTGVQDVEMGLFATNQGEENFDQFMRRIALTIEAYINGTNLSELPVFIKYNPRLIINYNTAELVGVPIKYSLIATTDFVGEFKNVLSEVEYDLLTAIAQGLNKNLSLATNQKDVELAGQDILSAKSNYLPKVSASVNATYVDPDAAANSFGQNPEFSTGGNITVQQTVFAPAINANVDIQKLLLKAQEANFNANELDIILDVANAYFNTLSLKANAQIQIRNLDLTKRNLQIAEQNYNSGETGKSDILRFRSEMAQNTQTMVQATNQLEQGFIGLNQVLNNPLNMEIDVEDVELAAGVFQQYNYQQLTELLDDPKLRESFIDFLVEEAIKNAPEKQSLSYNQAANERSIKLYEKGRYYPTVALQGQYNRVFSRHGAGSEGPQGSSLLDDNYNVGLNVSLPLFNQNVNNINQQTAEIQQEQLALNQANLEQGIAANMRVNVLNLANQVSNIRLSEVSENTAKEALELTQVAYSSGSVNIIQLIDAQNNFLNAQLARVNAVYNFLFNILQVERSLGYYFLLHSEEENEQFRQRFSAYLSK